MSDVKIKVATTVNVPIDKVWNCWVQPACIVKWNSASMDWHTVNATNDLKVGGRFLYRMEAKDGSVGFDFWGVYETVLDQELLEIRLGDGRKMSVEFKPTDNGTEITEIFDAETENSVELQRFGWQSILNNFKKIVESENE